jgi:soluble lytic murein transglycosylase-like protein
VDLLVHRLRAARRLGFHRQTTGAADTNLRVPADARGALVAAPRGRAAAGEDPMSDDFDPTTPIGTERPHETAARAVIWPHLVAGAATHGVPLSWLCAFARHESGFRNLRSRVGATDDRRGGAWGPFQTTAATARDLGFMPLFPLGEIGPAILSSPATGCDLGAKLIGSLRRRFGALNQVAGAYNAGAGAVLRGHVPQSTRERYVPAVVALAAEYSAALGAE